MALDDIILEPLAKGYNKLPAPVKQVRVILPQILELYYQFQIIFSRKF